MDGWKFEDSDPFTGDSFDHEITWCGKSLSEITEKEVSIDFRLDRAELFSFELR